MSISNALNPSSSLTLSKNDIKIFYSSASDGLALYLGGPRTTQELSDNYLHNFFQRTTTDEQITGITKYRCGYIFNANPNIYIKNPILFVVSNTTSPNDNVAVGWAGSSTIGTGLVNDPESVEFSINTENDEPLDVDFFDGNTRSEGAILGMDIPPGQGIAFWIQYISEFNAQDFPENTFVLRLVCDNLPHGVTITSTDLGRATITFPFIAECASNANFTKMINFILATRPDFIATAGNNNTDANPSFFLSAMSSYISKLAIAFGNRDVLNSTVTNAYTNALSKYSFTNNIARRYYSINFGNVHILFMDTSGATLYTNPSPQFTFVQQDLQNAFTDPKIDWIIVVTNRAMYSSQTTSAIRFLYADLRDTYHKMFTNMGVSIVVQGTYHFYERTKVLGYNASAPGTPTTGNAGGPQSYSFSGGKAMKEGQIYITCGTGGGLFDLINPLAPYSQQTDQGDVGYLLMKVDNTTSSKKLNVRYYTTSRQTQIFVDQFDLIQTG